MNTTTKRGNALLEYLRNYLAACVPTYKSARMPSNTKRGPGRFHVQGRIKIG